jgi:hypothetical protein
MNSSLEATEPIIAYFGHHKCASTWMRRILGDLCPLLGLTSFHTPWPLQLPLGFQSQEFFAERIRSSRVHCANGSFDLLMATNADQSLVIDLKPRRFRGFHLIRDPRDIVVSGYFSHRWSHPVHPRQNPWLLEHRKRLMELSEEDGIMLELEYASTYFARLSQWDYGNPMTYETRFEELIADPEAEMRRALAFCGILVGSTEAPAGVFRAVQCSEEAFAEVMRRNAFQRLSGGRPPGVQDKHSHLRSGRVGEYEQYFTPAIQAKFDRLYPELLVRLGYDNRSTGGSPELSDNPNRAWVR